MSAELLPCPFCQGGASIDHDVDGAAAITCTVCQIEQRWHSIASDAIAAWNRRAPAPEQPAAQGDGEHVETLLAMFTVCANERRMTEADALRAAIAALQRQPADAVARLNAERYEWLRTHFRFANDSMRELWFDPSLEPDDAGVQLDLDAAIDSARAEGGGR